MKMHFGLVVIFFAVPMLTVSGKEGLDDFVKFIKKAKDAKFYAKMETILSEPSTLFFVIENSDDPGLQQLAQQAKSVGKAEAIIEAAKIVVQLLQATLPEGANASDFELTEMAKKMSKFLRDSNLRIHTDMFDEGDAQLNNNTVAILKNVIANHRILPEGNIFVEIFEQKTRRLSLPAKGARRYDSAVKERLFNVLKFYSYDHDELFDEVALLEERRFNEFQMYSYFDHSLTFLQSEENAIEVFKDFGILASAVKNPRSYQSLEAVRKALSKSKLFEAFGLLEQHVTSCVFYPLPSIYKAETINSIQDFLPVIRLALSDKQNLAPDRLITALEDWRQIHEMNKFIVRRKLSVEYRKEGSIANLRKCLLNNDARVLFKQVIFSDTVLVPEEKLDELKNKSKLVYSVTQLLNIGARFYQRQVGLSHQAKAFTKQFVTVPNLLLFLSQYVSPSQEMLEKYVEAKNNAIRMFNELSADVKMELVEFDPYAVAMTLALLD